MKKRLIPIISFLIIFVLNVGILNAADGGGANPPVQGSGSNPISIMLVNPFRLGGNLFTLVKAIINNIVLPIGGMVAVLAFIYSGFLYVSSQGNDTKIKAAHQALLNTALGTAILMGAWAIANVIENTICQFQTSPNC